MNMKYLLGGAAIGLLMTTGAFAQSSTPNTPACPANMQISTQGATNNPKLATTEGNGAARAGQTNPRLAASEGNGAARAGQNRQLASSESVGNRSQMAANASPPGAPQNTAVRVGNGLARLPDGSLCRPIG